MKGFFFKVAIIIAIVLHFISCKKNDEQNDTTATDIQDTLITLSNTTAELKIDRYGGAFIDFHLNENPINPLSWKLEKNDMPPNNQNGAIFQGHFLCLGRWGSPTAGEIAAGIPHNGEPSNSLWRVSETGQQFIQMSNQASLDGMTVSRSVKLHPDQPVFKVNEEITNNLSIGRIYNIVQHATIGPPFLDTATIINTNADHGFLQELSFPDPHAFEYEWPLARLDTLNIDFRSSETQRSYVTTHVFKKAKDFGWIVAFNPQNRLLFGYVWPLQDYDWLNVWHQVNEGRVEAKGLEFGTTGIGRSYQDLIVADTRFYDQESFDYIDAGEHINKSFYGFLIAVDFSFESGEHQNDIIRNIHIENNMLVIQFYEADAIELDCSFDK